MKMMLLALAFLSQKALAIPENDYQRVLTQEVSPYFQSGSQRSFTTHDGLKLNFIAFNKSSSHKTLVILPGRTEPTSKYAELVYDLKDLDFNIYLLDHRGQGASDRLLKDSHKGHVKHFRDYISDLSGWMNEVVLPETIGQERFLIAHSMGGAIAVEYLSQNKNVFKKAILSAPMLELNTKPYKEGVARLLSGALTLIGQGTKYAPDRGPYVPSEDTFEKNEVTHSQVRFDMMKAIFVNEPELALGGPTNRWVNQSLKITKKIDSIAPQIETPLLMLQAGMDLIVKLGRQDEFCSKSLSCQKIHFPQSHHEILQEKDLIRDEALKTLKHFIQN